VLLYLHLMFYWNIMDSIIRLRFISGMYFHGVDNRGEFPTLLAEYPARRTISSIPLCVLRVVVPLARAYVVPSPYYNH
jgi:hypothetical protein